MATTVLELNVLRRPELFARIASRDQLVVPEVAIREALRNDDRWLRTLERSLVALVPYGHKVFMSAIAEDLIREEVASGQPISSAWDVDGTLLLRWVLRDLGSDGSLQAWRVPYDDVRARMLSELPGQAEMVTLASQALQMWQQILTDAGLKAVRKGQAEVARAALHDWTPSTCASLLVAHFGASPDLAHRLAVSHSFSRAYVTTALAFGLHWISSGGLDARPARRLVNDRIDLECITFGAFCGAFETTDTTAQAIFHLVLASWDESQGAP